jgi:hypothetical protein
VTEAGLADVYVELKRLERSTGVAKAAEIIEQAANAALKKLQARFSSKSGSVDANDSPTNAILEKVSGDARCIRAALVRSHEAPLSLAWYICQRICGACIALV